MSDNEDALLVSKLEPQLNAMEARILGALMEKQLTTPDAYPLTLNSLVLACNQKTSREPVTNYSNAEVQRCLRSLEERKLVDVDYGSRADRYAQRLTRILGIDKSVQAILNVMLLRGAQTVHELLTRTQRMYEFSNDAEVEVLLEHLIEKVVPMIMRVPRQSAQREDRFVHLLSGEPDLSAIATIGHHAKASTNNDLEERVVKLEEQVAELERIIAGLTED
jgi:hypothetical protein